MFSKLLGNSGRKMKTAVLVNTIATISLMTTQSSVTHARLDNKKVDDKNNNDEDDKKPNDFSQWMKNIGENAKATADPSNFKNILSQERLKKISRPINEIFASGLPGEVLF